MASEITERQRQYREEYLRSSHWRSTRLAALVRAGNRCQVCNAPERLDVHHRTYERVGAERPEDLTVLCRRCHDLYHGSSKPKPARRKPRKAKARKRQVPKKVSKLEAENERLHAIQERNREKRAAAEASRAPRVVVIRPGEGVRS